MPVKSCLSPKLYAVWYNRNAVKGSKLPISLFDAYKNGYKILDYSYVLDCIQANELLSQKGYEILLPLLPKGMTKKRVCMQNILKRDLDLSHTSKKDGSKRKTTVFPKTGNPG